MPETIFSIVSTIALIGWAILLLGPRRWAVVNAIPQFAIPLLLSALYAVLVLTRWSSAEGGFGTLADLRALFASDWLLLAGWVHYLAFDLFVGSWLARRLDAAGLGRMLQAALLLPVFLLGPLGFLLALTTETALRARRAAPLETRP